MKFLNTMAKLTLIILAAVLLLHVGNRMQTRAGILPEETTPAPIQDPDRIAQLEARVEELSRDKERLTEEVEKYRAQAGKNCILVLRYEERFLPNLFGDWIVIERAVQEIAVSRELYESCRTGDDITSLELHRLMTCGGLSDTRVIVENKYIKT